MRRRRILEQENLERIVLAELLKAGPLSYTQLYKRTLKLCGTPATFEAIFNHLKATGRIAKTASSHRAPYIITDKGKRFLEGI
ncbi:MAG: hypothetical protein QW161_05125 [Candidatus Bathyarchaeia archaeon]